MRQFLYGRRTYEQQRCFLRPRRGEQWHWQLLHEMLLEEWNKEFLVLCQQFFGIGYGAYYSTADLPIPMVADCSDYETYRSGNFIPGIMGTMFSLVDKLVSSLTALIVSVAITFIGLENLPTETTPYVDGMNWVMIVLFCIIPMLAWIATLIAMKGYSLTGTRMKEIQAVNAQRKEAIASGMSLEEAMEKFQ